MFSSVNNERKTMAEMSVSELKVAAWDLAMVVERLNRELTILRNEIEARQRTASNAESTETAG